jgi:hypothetical protein
MSADLSRLTTMVLLTYPFAVELSVCIGERNWGHPILLSMLRRGTMSCATMNNAPISASAAEGQTYLMIREIDNIGPLLRGIGSSSERNMCPPARLRDLGSLLKLASK